MKRELEPIGRSLIFSKCCRVTPTGIEWLREPTPEELDGDDYTIQRCEESVGWWQGDMIVKRWKREGVDKTLSEFAAEYARVRGRNEDHAIAQAHVSQFFPLCDRSHRPLKWTHHYLVWRWKGGEGLRSGRLWLMRAVQGEKGSAWSTGRLRAELGKAKRKDTEETEPPAPRGAWDDVTDLETWAESKLQIVKQVSAKEAQVILSHMASTVALIDSLRAKLTRKSE